ncbi:MAG: hypothetical protein KKB25_01985 [Nanoarchaeota archaeon]|nr:hypothetical protein [Nanoarchaeota archaeon]
MKDIIAQGLKGNNVICPVKIFGKPPKEIQILLGDCESCDGVLKQEAIKINESLHDFGIYTTGMFVYEKHGCEMKVYSEPKVLP